MRHDGWAELVNDEEHGRCLDPHDDAPQTRKCAPSDQSPAAGKCDRAHGGWAVGGISVFQGTSRADAGTTFTPEPRRTAPKVRRNDPCPCGSGKKCKRWGGGQLSGTRHCTDETLHLNVTRLPKLPKVPKDFLKFGGPGFPVSMRKQSCYS
jgi:SEC-C motif